VAVLPNGKTNLIAHDLGAGGDPLETLERVLEHRPRRPGAAHRPARADHFVGRVRARRPVLGMFLGGAYLADTMLYCRNKIYPLGLPNGSPMCWRCCSGCSG
jgi:hypothetical protein